MLLSLLDLAFVIIIFPVLSESWVGHFPNMSVHDLVLPVIQFCKKVLKISCSISVKMNAKILHIKYVI